MSGRPTTHEVFLHERFLHSAVPCGGDMDARFVTKVALGGRALTQREAPHLSMLAARIHGNTLQMATELLDDTLEAPCPESKSTGGKTWKIGWEA